MSAAAKYVQEGEAPEEQPAAKVCAEAGRRCVKMIRQYPVLSSEWIQTVDSFKQLTRLVVVEGRIAPNAKVSEAQGRNSDGGTLWDQEAHENAIRILVEEAKVNLCLRIMNDYKKWYYDECQKKADISVCKNEMGYPEVHIDQLLIDFEVSLGMILARAFMHVETLQLMDIPLLIEHIHMVLTSSTPGQAGARMQETVVLYYFSSLMKHAEKLNNLELLAKTRELGVLHLITNQALAVCMEPDLMLIVAEGHAALADNEDFNSDWQSFFTGPDGRIDANAKANFLLLEEKIVNPVLQASPEKRKDLRPVLDFFKTLKR